jgi:hypothetical protein
MDPTILLQQRGGSNLMKTTKALFARGMHHLTETNLECYFLAGIIVEIKTEGVKTLFSKSIEAAGPGVWIDGQSHRYCSGYSAKEIKVAEVDSGILPSGWSIKMVRHISSLWLEENCVLTFVESNAKTLQLLPRKLSRSEQMFTKPPTTVENEYLKRQRR